MANDILSALTGPVKNEDQMQALADALRKRKRAADFFSMTTIKPLAAAGRAASDEVTASAKQQGLLRESLAQRLSDEQVAQAKADAQATRDAKTDEYRSAQLGLSQARLAAAQAKGGGYNEPKTQKERESFEKGGVRASTLKDLQVTFKDEYANSAKDGDIPLTGDITNFLGRKLEGYVSQEWTDKSNWWQGYKEKADLVRRHELFGSALTKSEQAQYDRAMITATDGPVTIRRKLAEQSAYENKVAELAAASALQKGYDPKQVMMNFGDVVDVGSLIDKVADGSFFKDLEARQAADRASNPKAYSGTTEPVDELEKQAQEAIANGADPEAVRKRLEAIRSGQQ